MWTTLVWKVLSTSSKKKKKSRLQLGRVSSNPQLDGAMIPTEMRNMLKEIFSAGCKGMRKEKVRHLA